jgi:hypothetical protein
MTALAKRRAISSQRCTNCGRFAVNWHEAKASYARMIKRGMTPEQAKNLSPRCGKCVTETMVPVHVVHEVRDPPHGL